MMNDNAQTIGAIQHLFAQNAVRVLSEDTSVVGLAVGGSWLTKEIDEFSDLDLILVTRKKVSDDISKMLGYARNLGDLLTGFTGNHVGELRLLICLYESPLLHVDIKFLTIDEFESRVETPEILLDTNNELSDDLTKSKAVFPYPDYQWMEDRFWVWIRYALLKIQRGEFVEALDFFGFLRSAVLGPLLHIKNNNLPRGVRKVETSLSESDLKDLLLTIPLYERNALLDSLRHAISLYKDLRSMLFPEQVVLQTRTEEKVMLLLNECIYPKDNL